MANEMQSLLGGADERTGQPPAPSEEAIACADDNVSPEEVLVRENIAAWLAARELCSNDLDRLTLASHARMSLDHAEFFPIGNMAEIRSQLSGLAKPAQDLSKGLAKLRGGALDLLRKNAFTQSTEAPAARLKGSPADVFRTQLTTLQGSLQQFICTLSAASADAAHIRNRPSKVDTRGLENAIRDIAHAWNTKIRKKPSAYKGSQFVAFLNEVGFPPLEDRVIQRALKALA